MLRQAKQSDFVFVFPILKQIFDEMQLTSINQLPPAQFYDLMRLGFLSDDYRYSHRRMWVSIKNNQVQGIIDMYPFVAQQIIDIAFKPAYVKVGLPQRTVIFSDQEAWPHEYYIDALAVAPKVWHHGIGTSLLQFAARHARQCGYHCLSLNVDQDNQRAKQLYLEQDFHT